MCSIKNRASPAILTDTRLDGRTAMNRRDHKLSRHLHASALTSKSKFHVSAGAGKTFWTSAARTLVLHEALRGNTCWNSHQFWKVRKDNACLVRHWLRWIPLITKSTACSFADFPMSAFTSPEVHTGNPPTRGQRPRAFRAQAKSCCMMPTSLRMQAGSCCTNTR